MTPTEAVILCRYAKAFFPHQHFDEYTPDAWHDTLARYPFEDCKAAVVTVSGVLEFCTPKNIHAEVKRVRSLRLEAFGPFEPPPGLPDVDYPRWLGEERRKIADGEITSRDEMPGQVAARHREVDYAELMPRVPADVVSQARAGIAGARLGLCKPHHERDCTRCAATAPPTTRATTRAAGETEEDVT
jgi:hypothetical protein